MYLDHLIIWLSRRFRFMHRILILSLISMARQMVMATTESCAHLFYCIIHGAKKSISNLVVIVCVRATCDTIIAHFYLNCPEQQYEVRQRNSYM